jgi:hypothetical protein
MKFLRHIFIIILFINLLLSCAAHLKLKEQEPEMRPDYNLRPFYIQAVRGDMNDAMSMLDTVPEYKLSEEQLALKKQFYDRFITDKDTDTILTNDPLIDGTLQGFRRYWNSVLMDKMTREPAKSELLSHLTDLVYTHQFHGNMPRDTISANLQKHLTESIIDRGYFTNVLSHTGGYLDLFLWQKQQDSIFTVQLPDDEIDVHVVLMDDFLSIGWTEYATLGKYHAGGWANPKALYCVKKSYDLSGEAFRGSFLTHEAQHFSDYKNFPQLEQADLEYRAKLAELHAAEETSKSLLEKFILNAKHDRSYAHPFANYHVIRDLSREIFNEEFVENPEKWETIPVERIQNASHDLLKRHTQALRAAGAEQVRAYLK